MSISSIANYLLQVFDFDALPHQTQLETAGLRINLRSESEGTTDWLANNFGNIQDETPEPITQTYEVASIWSDRTVREAIEMVDSEKFASETFTRRGTFFIRLTISESIALDYIPELGVVWITDNSSQKIAMIYSSRTPMFAMELRIGMIDLVNRHMEHDGWHTIHGGCVRFNDNDRETTLVMIGDSGAGKTTLMTHFVSGGATYLGNERLFVQHRDGRIHVRAYPQTIGIGMGTAMQHQGIEPLIERPDRLSYYQKAFEPERVWNTPPEQLAALPDKLKLLPTELATALGSPPPIAASTIDAIVIPSLTDAASDEANLTELSPQDTYEIVTRNYFPSERDELYPRWLPLASSYFAGLDPAPACRQLSETPTVLFQYTTTTSAESIIDSAQAIVAQTAH